VVVPATGTDLRDAGGRGGTADQLDAAGLVQLGQDLLRPERHVVAGGGNNVDVRVRLHQVLGGSDPPRSREGALPYADDLDVGMRTDLLTDRLELGRLRRNRGPGDDDADLTRS
jgi:hypothetical protein